jgi:hypothetical protein
LPPSQTGGVDILNKLATRMAESPVFDKRAIAWHTSTSDASARHRPWCYPQILLAIDQQRLDNIMLGPGGIDGEISSAHCQPYIEPVTVAYPQAFCASSTSALVSLLSPRLCADCLLHGAAECGRCQSRGRNAASRPGGDQAAPSSTMARRADYTVAAL